jgi:hypothetical protein
MTVPVVKADPRRVRFFALAAALHAVRKEKNGIHSRGLSRNASRA